MKTIERNSSRAPALPRLSVSPGDGMQRELRSILYVEDDPHVRTTAKLVLEVLGKFEVRACGSGRDALVVGLGFRPDLILLDVMMPGLDGLATLSLLRRMPHLAGTPAMFLTGLTAPDDLARYTSAGVIGVIAKPIAPMRLAAQLHAVWSQRARDPLIDAGTAWAGRSLDMMVDLSARRRSDHLSHRATNENKGSDSMESGPAADNRRG